MMINGISRLRLRVPVHGVVANRVANFSKYIDFSVKLRTIFHNKTKTKIKKIQ